MCLRPRFKAITLHTRNCKTIRIRNRINLDIVTYCCFNKLWAFTADKFDTLKHVNELNVLHSVHKIGNCYVGSTPCSTITGEYKTCRNNSFE